MIQFYDKRGIRDILLNSPFTKEDLGVLNVILSRDSIIFNIYFNYIYSIKEDLILLLYEKIFVEELRIYLISYNSKLTKYLHALGFKAQFSPFLIKELRIKKHTMSDENRILYTNILKKELDDSEWISFLLKEIYKQYNYDFRLYKLDMIKRRVTIFLIKYEIKTIKDAVIFILFNKNVFHAFFFEISINVTEFFRNPDSFSHIKELLTVTYKNKNHIKIWSVGCSSGEEAYSLAMLLDDTEKSKKSLIYATDFNSVILENAKTGVYSNRSYTTLQNNLLKINKESYIVKYIKKYNNFFTLSENIRNKVLFLEHNLIIDTSFNEFDIIICKNVIIYFNEDLQNRVFTLIYDSLRFGGYLILGESEALSLSFVDKFSVINSQSKIYKKVA